MDIDGAKEMRFGSFGKLPCARRAVFLFDIDCTGGPLTFVQRASRYLPNFGWETRVVAAGSRRPRSWDASAFTAPLTVTPTAYSAIRLAQRLGRAIAEFDAEVVVGMPNESSALVMRHLYRTRQSRARFLDVLHSDNPCEYERIRGNADVAAAVAAVNDDAVSRLGKEIPSLTGRAYRIWYPVPALEGPPGDKGREGPLRLIYLGRLAQQYKRVLDLAPIVEDLLARRIDFSFSIVGDGPERKRLEELLAAVPGAAERVQFHGWLSNEEALRMLAAHDVLLLVSDVEGQPLALLEAMGQGVVPVVTQLPGMRALIGGGETGFCLPVGAADQFADRIAQLASNGDLLRRMSRASWELIYNTHRTDAAVGKLAELLDNVAGLPLPDPQQLPENIYPECICTRFGLPVILQEVLHWYRGKELR